MTIHLSAESLFGHTICRRKKNESENKNESLGN